jgi:hypothetical protein
MRSGSSRILDRAVLVLFLLGILLPARAHAYIDGGTGAMLFQLLIGGLAASLFFIRQFWAKIKTFFASLGKKPN